MNTEVYVVRLIDENNDGLDELIGVIKNIDVVDKVIYQLHEERGLEFETLASKWSSKYWKFTCLTCKTYYLLLNKVPLIE